jgi:hypothetical protein
MIRFSLPGTLIALLVSGTATAAPSRTNTTDFIRAINTMMVALGPETAAGSAAIRREYREYFNLLALDEYSDLQGALATGGLAPLPSNPEQFNLVPRLAGAHPIAEKDLENQGSYVSARPATIGALLEVASQVHSGPVEVTSLVRHSEYQGELKTSNSNAITSLPMHVMGLAFDIAVINTPLTTVYEIRDVLRRMRDAGDILFIAERKQLVFHVVPNPARLGHFTDVYTKALGFAPAAQAAQVVAADPGPAVRRTTGVPRVIAEVLAIIPADHALYAEWQAALPPSSSVAQSAGVIPTTGAAVSVASFARGSLALIAAFLAVTSRILRRHERRAAPRLRLS